MKIATIVLTYNRAEHTQRVLDALRNNTRKPEKLYIFQDGLRDEQNRESWDKVNTLIQKVDWCDCEVHVSERNQGLRKAIVGGINYAFTKNDAVIVLEDDCVTHPMFMEYMYQALHKYRDNPSVYNVNGYAYNVEVPANGADAYFMGRASSWGWGTWKRCWQEYEEDYEIITRIHKDAGLTKRLHEWGDDLESYLYGNLKGTCNSWATFWSLKVIEREGSCLSPYQSLVSNIGMDGSGTHCGTVEVWEEHMRDWDDMREIQLPDMIEIPKEIELGYSNYFFWTAPEDKLRINTDILTTWIRLQNSGWSLAGYLASKQMTKVSIWGLGKIGKLVLEQLLADDRITVQAIVLSNPTIKEEQGIPIVDSRHIPTESQLIIVIPTYDFLRISKVVDKATSDKLIRVDQLLET